MTTERKVIMTNNYGDIIIPFSAIEEICLAGDNEPACKEWLDKVDWCGYTDEQIIKELDETGAWCQEDGDYDDAELNKMRFLWLAAWDCHEDPDLFDFVEENDDEPRT